MNYGWGTSKAGKFKTWNENRKKSFCHCLLMLFWISLSWSSLFIIQKGGDFKIGFLLQDPIIWYPNKYYILSKVHRISTISALSENIWRIIFPHWVEKVYSSSHYENYYLPHNNVAIFTRRKNLIGRKKNILISFDMTCASKYLSNISYLFISAKCVWNLKSAFFSLPTSKNRYTNICRIFQKIWLSLIFSSHVIMHWGNIFTLYIHRYS